MKNYELMYILNPEIAAEDIQAKNASLQKIITDNGGKITGVKEWGMRELAYEIKKQKKGYYVVIDFTADNRALDEFNRIVSLDSKVLRFLITLASK